MLKLMNSVIIFVILCGGVIQSIIGESLHCEFQDVGFVWGSMYTCHVSSLDNSRNNMVIKSHTGTHLANKNDNDVKAIRIESSNTKYIPAGLGSLFNLTAFAVERSELIEIKADNFLGMQNMEYLYFSDNQLSSVPSDVFSTLHKLKGIFLESNQIKYIGSGAFDQLTNLYFMNLRNNICVNKIYNGANEITQMKEDLKVNCVEPLSTSTTTQNPMEVVLAALRNKLLEAEKKQNWNENELNKLWDELQMEILENTKLTKEHQEIQSRNVELISELSALKLDLQNKVNEIKNVNNERSNLKNKLAAAQKDLKRKPQEKIQLINENKVLKKHLNEAKATAQQSLLKNEQTITILTEEVMELKDQRQLERTTYREVRSKLLKANIKLASCETSFTVDEMSLV